MERLVLEFLYSDITLQPRTMDRKQRTSVYSVAETTIEIQPPVLSVALNR